ncbi:transposase, partial [Escherichia coli]
MVCNYRYKNRQCHCLSGGYMARSAKPRKRKPASQRSKLPRYVVKLHEDDFFDEEDAEVFGSYLKKPPVPMSRLEHYAGQDEIGLRYNSHRTKREEYLLMSGDEFME